jgi:hypothetical protein
MTVAAHQPYVYNTQALRPTPLVPAAVVVCIQVVHKPIPGVTAAMVNWW